MQRYRGVDPVRRGRAGLSGAAVRAAAGLYRWCRPVADRQPAADYQSALPQLLVAQLVRLLSPLPLRCGDRARRVGHFLRLVPLASGSPAARTGMIGRPASRSELRHFALGAALVLVPAFLLWWLAVDMVVAGLRPVAAWVAHLLMPITAFAPESGRGWIVKTSLEVTFGKTIPGPEIATFELQADWLRRLTVAWPLFLALMLAPPRPPRLVGRLFAGVLMLALLFILSACSVAFCLLAVLVNHQPAGSNDLMPPAILCRMAGV
jgi:hypothetical protein